MTDGEQLAPYKGLRMFEDAAADVPFFFGRGRERDLLEANLMASRLTVVYGETGVGKSSLLRAGVAHHLRAVAAANLAEHGEPELAVVVFDAWRGDPVASLRRAVAEEVTHALGGTAPPPDAEGSLTETLRAWQELLGGDLYVLLDQAEEYFLYHGVEAETGTFAVEFPRAVAAPGLRVNFLLAVREDALARLDQFKTGLPNVLGNYLRLEHLDRESARTAITAPVARYNELVGREAAVEVEEALVEAVLEQVATGRVRGRRNGRGNGAIAGETQGGRIETPYLQLVMRRIWDAERDAGSRTLRLATLQRLGGAGRIVGDHVAGALGALPGADQDLAASVFEHLVTPSGTKVAHGVDDLARYAAAPPTAVASVLERLGADRIVRSVADDDAAGRRYEIFHDLLAEPVLTWKTEHDAQQNLAQQWAEADRRHRRLLKVMTVAVALIAGTAALAVFAFVQRGEARSQARIAHARELAARADSVLQVDPQRSLALAIASARLKPTAEAENVLRQALIGSRERAILPTGGPVRTASFSPDGSLVLTAGDGGSARIWRPDGTPVETLAQPGRVVAAAFSPDGALALTAGSDGTARVWKVATGALIASLRHGGPLTSGSFGRDGRYALTTSMDGTARLWRVGDWSLVRMVREAGPVWTAALGNDDRRLVTVAGDRNGGKRRARLYALPGGRMIRELQAIGVTAASFSPDARLVVTGGLDHTAAVFDAAGGKRLHLLADHQQAVTDAVFGPGGRLIATTSADGATRVWDARTGARVALMLGHANAVETASFSRDGRFLVTASADGTARVWEVATGRFVQVLRGHSDAVLDARFSPDGRLVVTAGADGTARTWDPGTAPELRAIATFAGAVRSASFSPDGQRVLEAGDDGAARIMTRDGRVLHVFRQTAPVTAAAFSPDGRSIVTADARRTIRVWQAEGGKPLRTVRGISSGPLRYSSDGRLLAAPDARGVLRILDAQTLATVRVVNQGAPFTAAAFSPDGRLLATAGADGAARVWDARSGAVVRILVGHKDALTDVEFSRDSTLLVTASRDHDARVWEVATGSVTLLRGHFGPVFGASFDPDGRFVVTAGPSTAGVWPSSSGQLLAYLHGARGVLTSASFSPDGDWILTSDRGGAVSVYRCELCGGFGELVALADARLNALARPLRAAERGRFVPPDA